MPVYEVGVFGSTGQGGGSPGGFSAENWQPPLTMSLDRRVFTVSRGSYIPGSLELALSAVPQGEIGFSYQFPPTFHETNPGSGVFTLSDALPEQWLVLVRYQFV